MCGARWIDLDRKSIILNDDEASKDAGTLCWWPLYVVGYKKQS
jgi:hypothetical protein